MLALNLQSGYTLCRVIAPIMLGQKQGSIINIASKAGVDPSPGASAQRTKGCRHSDDDGACG
jgi:short-subunit dehydrogenase